MKDILPADAVREDGAGFGIPAQNDESQQFIESNQPLTPDRETQLFHSFLSGNDAAFRTLYDAFERSLYIYCCRLLKNEVEAKDLFQDIWIRMYKMRGERIQVRRFSGLLFTVARNYCLNAIRDNRGSSNLSLDDMSEDSEIFLRSNDIENADLRELLQRALSQLPFNQRESFILREYIGYSYDEIADIMGTTTPNVRARAHRARERLRTIVGAWLELKNK
ncbi:MAG: RNA polymerase sigma factor [Bacteroidota bacterium]|nr:RNA polymerase sigma factor [Bacteroidota bacterium]MDP4237327.1 RNA polymerase sigma factor [Bacteroidota bacterium]